MKKLALIAVLGFMASTASAVTLTWAATGIKFDGNTIKNSTDVTGYLIYLGTSTFSDSYSVSKDSTVDTIISSIGTKVDTKNKTSAVGKINGEWTFNYSDGYSNGDTFAILLTYATGGKTYYNLASDIVTLAGGNDVDVASQTPATDPSNVTGSFSFATAGEKDSIAKGGGWTVAVPEPSTAALALAGLALLIKRRRA